MGSQIEVNDTLKLPSAKIPKDLQPGVEYPFALAGRRLFHLDPVRVFLVEEIEGKWNFLGHALIQESTIDARKEETRGVFVVRSLYPVEEREAVNLREAPPGKAYRSKA